MVISEYNGGDNDPEEKLDKAMTLAAFDAHGYRWPTIGWMEHILGFTVEDVEGYWNYWAKLREAEVKQLGIVTESPPPEEDK